jgi:hypothetical protein
MSARRPWQGTLAIARFNWPFYAAALVVLTISLLSLWMSSAFVSKVISALGLAGSAYFLFGSLGVSHLIYDRSDLYRWVWLKRALDGANVQRAISCHCGFDETSNQLAERVGQAEWQVLDHFDEAQMTESSIRRARRLFPPTPGTLPAPHDRWPIATASVDAVFGLLAIHELRSDSERGTWFAEARRCLLPNGSVILVEHLRDIANFIAFGPGFLHFHSRRTWERAWEKAGFRLADEFRVTPWIRVFVLRAP